MSPVSRSPVEAPPAAVDKGKILVVESHEELRSVLVEFLLSRAYRVVVAESAEDALSAQGDAGRFDLIITDSTLPGMSGVDLAERVGPDVPVIVLVSRPGISASFRARTGRAVTVVRKPFSIERLGEQVRRSIGESHKDDKDATPSSLPSGHGARLS